MRITVKTTQAIMLIAVFMIAPFAILEIYLVATIGMTEPYSYIWSIPLGVVSFALMQAALLLGMVKGWKKYINKAGCYLIAIWAISAILIFILPLLFPNKLSFL